MVDYLINKVELPKTMSGKDAISFLGSVARSENLFSTHSFPYKIESKTEIKPPDDLKDLLFGYSGNADLLKFVAITPASTPSIKYSGFVTVVDPKKEYDSLLIGYCIKNEEVPSDMDKMMSNSQKNNVSSSDQVFFVLDAREESNQIKDMEGLTSYLEEKIKKESEKIKSEEELRESGIGFTA